MVKYSNLLTIFLDFSIIKYIQKGAVVTVAVKKWGNSLALRIPKDIAKTLLVQESSLLELEIVQNGLLLKPKKKSRLEELVAQIDESNLHGEIETGEALGNEEW